MRRFLARPALALALAAAPFLGACSNSGGKSEPPPGPADPPPPADDPGAGFATPPPADEKPSTEPPPAVSAELTARIKQTFGAECRHERSCGSMMGIDCNAAVDGPYYYVRSTSLEVVSTCGGACMRGCTNCPPKEWTCATY